MNTLVLTLPLLLAAPVPKEHRNPAPKLDGIWQVTSYETNGRETKVTSVLNQTWTIEGNKLTITRANSATNTLINIRAEAKTREFDYTLPNNNLTRKGRYELKGDTLIIALPLSDPNQRLDNTDGGQGRYRYTFKRVQPTK